MISQHGIDQYKIIIVFEIVEEVADDSHLFHGSEVARVNRIEMKVQFFPVFDECFHVIGQIEGTKVLVLAMGGQYGRR